MTIYRSNSRYEASGTHSYNKRGHNGRNRASRIQDRFIRASVRRYRTLNTTQINRTLRKIMGVAVLAAYIRNRLHTRRRASCRLLLPIDQSVRMRLAQAHSNWGIAECRHVLLMKLSLIYSQVGPMLVWRRQNDWYLKENMENKVILTGGAVTVCRVVSCGMVEQI